MAGGEESRPVDDKLSRAAAQGTPAAAAAHTHLQRSLARGFPLQEGGDVVPGGQVLIRRRVPLAAYRVLC